ncbi:hypothetical protein DsansV1_C17g0146111 [Dioscorea sansibarensis]
MEKECHCWLHLSLHLLRLFFPIALSTKVLPTVIYRYCAERLTATTESRAATARMSAQDTTCLHALSTFDLIVSITSKPRSEFLLGVAVFSPVKLEVSSSRTDASQPCHYYI